MSDQRPGAPDFFLAPGDAALRQAGAEPLRPKDPARIGPYVPLGLLGSGGMGRVYLARAADARAPHPGLAAVKVIRPEYAEDADFRRRFEREATVHARVGAPYTPELWGTGFESEDELLWMATEYLPGLNLSDAVRQCGVLGQAGAWRLVDGLGQALTALADSGIVHRDFKPSNVILSEQGVHVIDFGIAQAVGGSAITTTGNRVGTPAFMSPEYLRDGSCDTASDVFSFASTLVFAVTGHAPFGDGTGMDVLHRIASEQPSAEVMAEVAESDPALAALLTACLTKAPAERPTPRDLADAAAAQPPAVRAASWQDPLNSRLSSRRQAYETLRDTPEQPTTRLRTTTKQVTHPVPVPGFGPPIPPPSPDTHAPPATRRGKRYAVIAAGLAVAAVAVTAFALTRPDTTADATSSAASSPTATTSAPDGSYRNIPLPSQSGSTSPSPTKAKGSPGTDEQSATGTTPPAKASTTPTQNPPATPSTPAGTPTQAPANPPWLTECTYYSGTELTQRGDKGQRVVQVQCMLTKRGYSVGSSGVDGDFGSATDAAVRAFQGDKGLEVDGQVGTNTWAALRSST